jgi:hypothetical protein
VKAGAACPRETVSLPGVSVGTLSGDQRRSVGTLSAARTRVLDDPAAAAVAVLLVLAAVLRFTHIGHQGFWFDEANTAADTHHSAGAMLGLLPQNETTPPLFYCIAWVWARVFGFGEVSLRSLSALSGVAAVALVYAATTKLITRRAGLVAAALTACNPFLVWYSQEFRPYELLVAFSAAGLLAFAYAHERPTPRALAAWAIISALALADHYYALLLVIPEAVWLLVVHRHLIHRHRRSWGVPLAIAFVGACGLALLPLAISQNSTGNASWIAPIPLLPRLGQIVPQFLIGFQTPVQTVLERVAEACVLVGFGLLALRAGRLERRGALIVGTLAGAGFVLNLILIAGGIDDLITRNLIGLWPPAAMLVAAGLGARRSGWLGIVATVALCVTGVVAVAGVAVDRSFQRPDWRGVGRVLGAHPAAGSGARAILVQDYLDLLPLSLYLPGLKFLDGARTRASANGPPVRVSEFDVVSIRSPRVPLCWWGAACNLSGSRMQKRYAIPGFRILWRRQAYQFTIMRMVAPRPVAVTPEEIAAALRSTTFRRDELLFQPPT